MLVEVVVEDCVEVELLEELLVEAELRVAVVELVAGAFVLDAVLVVVEPPAVAINATTIPIARTLAIAMTVLAFVLMHRAYAPAPSLPLNQPDCDSVSVEFGPRQIGFGRESTQ